MQPEDEERDCEYCRTYLHYGFKDPDPKKRGEPCLYGGVPRKRPARNQPDCGNCPKAWAWTAENRVIYERWMMTRAGVRMGPVTGMHATGFMLLEEAEHRIAEKSRASALAKALAGVFTRG